MPVDKVELVSVNVALPSVIGQHRGRPLSSAIDKQAVDAPVLRLTTTNLEGDRQADLSVHGGPDKAVYAYPSEHIASWATELGASLGAGAFGENLTTLGATEADVCIGDLWAWGDALLQLCQPRWPCFKLTLYRGVSDMATRFRASGRTGWYFRVLQEGDVPAAGPLVLVEPDPAGVTVLDAHRAALPSSSVDEIARVLAVPALAREWQMQVGG